MSSAQHHNNQSISDGGSGQQERSNVPVHGLSIVDGQFAGDVQKGAVGLAQLIVEARVGLQRRIGGIVYFIGGIGGQQSGQFGAEERREVVFASFVISRVSDVLVLEVVIVPVHFIGVHV